MAGRCREPGVPDPDGHSIRFYTVQHHTETGTAGVTTIHDPRETAERRERLMRGTVGASHRT